jgi:hypothetical protein
MSAQPTTPAAPVGQQGPPALAAASAMEHAASRAGPSCRLPGRPTTGA